MTNTHTQAQSGRLRFSELPKCHQNTVHVHRTSTQLPWATALGVPTAQGALTSRHGDSLPKLPPLFSTGLSLLWAAVLMGWFGVRHPPGAAGPAPSPTCVTALLLHMAAASSTHRSQHTPRDTAHLRQDPKLTGPLPRLKATSYVPGSPGGGCLGVSVPSNRSAPTLPAQQPPNPSLQTPFLRFPWIFISFPTQPQHLPPGTGCFTSEMPLGVLLGLFRLAGFPSAEGLHPRWPPEGTPVPGPIFLSQGCLSSHGWRV